MIARIQKKCKCTFTGEWIEMWYIHKMEYYSALTKVKLLSSVKSWMHLEQWPPTILAQDCFCGRQFFRGQRVGRVVWGWFKHTTFTVPIAHLLLRSLVSNRPWLVLVPGPETGDPSSRGYYVKWNKHKQINGILKKQTSEVFS